MRGDISLGSLPQQLRNLYHDLLSSSALERQQPTPNTNNGTGRRVP